MTTENELILGAIADGHHTLQAIKLRVYLAIRAQPQTPKAVSKLLGLPYGGVCTAVSRLRDCGYLAPVKRRGKYTIYSVTDRPELAKVWR